MQWNEVVGGSSVILKQKRLSNWEKRKKNNYKSIWFLRYARTKCIECTLIRFPLSVQINRTDRIWLIGCIFILLITTMGYLRTKGWEIAILFITLEWKRDPISLSQFHLNFTRDDPYPPFHSPCIDPNLPERACVCKRRERCTRSPHQPDPKIIKMNRSFFRPGLGICLLQWERHCHPLVCLPSSACETIVQFIARKRKSWFCKCSIV